MHCSSSALANYKSRWHIRSKTYLWLRIASIGAIYLILRWRWHSVVNEISEGLLCGCRAELHSEDGPIKWLLRQMLAASSMRLRSAAAVSVAAALVSSSRAASHYLHELEQLLTAAATEPDSEVPLVCRRSSTAVALAVFSWPFALPEHIPAAAAGGVGAMALLQQHRRLQFGRTIPLARNKTPRPNLMTIWGRSS